MSICDEKFTNDRKIFIYLIKHACLHSRSDYNL